MLETNHLELAKQAIKAGDALTASIEATKAIETEPDNYEAYVIRGQISMFFGDKAGAADDLKRAVELNPDLLQQMSGEFRNDKGSSCH